MVVLVGTDRRVEVGQSTLSWHPLPNIDVSAGRVHANAAPIYAIQTGSAASLNHGSPLTHATRGILDDYKSIEEVFGRNVRGA